MLNYTYQVGGSLPINAPTYVKRKADDDLYNALKNGDFCYVLNSRQMGKSSLRVRTMKRLEDENYACIAIDITSIGTSNITPEQWYLGIIDEITNSLELYDYLEVDDWLKEHDELSIVNRLSKFLKEVLLQYIEQNIVIFVDEIDSILSLPFSLDDFFAMIRDCYNKRADHSEYDRLTFCLIGVATPSDLIGDKRRTSFNIGTAIELTGFTSEEAEPLRLGLEGVTNNSKIVMQEILKWTGGQPFLTQKVCKLLLASPVIARRNTQENQSIFPQDNLAEAISELVEETIIKNWETQDEPEHLRTIQNRILVNQKTANILLSLYKQVLINNLDFLQGSIEETRLRLTGLVVKKDNSLRVYNQIYAQVFNQDWVNHELEKLRPYSENFNAWVESHYEDESRLLRGQSLQDALMWAVNKSLAPEDYRYLEASQKLEQRLTELELETQKQANKILTEAKQKAETALIKANQKLTEIKKKTDKLVHERLTMLKLANVRLIAASAKEKLLLEQPFDSLIESLKAAQQLKKNDPSVWHRNHTYSQVFMILHQAIYSVRNYQTIAGHNKYVIGVSFSPDGKIIASASADNTIKLWRLDGTLIKTLEGHSDWVYDVCFSPDGKIIASASKDQTIKLWRLDGTLIKTLEGHNHTVYGVTFSPDGKMIASASADNTIKLWRLDGTLIKTIEGHRDIVYQVKFSPDGEIMASASADNTIKLWKIDGTLIKTLEGHSEVVYQANFSPDGEIIISASGDQTIKLWQKDGTLIKTILAHSKTVYGVSFSPNGKIFASAGFDNKVKFWRRDGTLLKTFSGHVNWVNRVCFSPDGETVASASDDNTVKLWKPEGILLQTLADHQHWVYDVSFSPDGQAIATASKDQTIKLWTKEGKLINTLNGHEDLVNGISFSPDGKIIASASKDHTVKLWTADGKLITTLNSHQDWVHGVKFSPDGKILASSSFDKTIKLWTIDGKLITTFYGHTDEINNLSFSPNGELIASASADNTVKLWQLDGTLVNTLVGHSRWVHGVTFSPNGEIIASASGDNTVKLWKRDGTLWKTLTDHKSWVLDVSFSPDGKTIASVSDDNTVKLWKFDGTLLKTFCGHTNIIYAVKFSPDGKILASASGDNTVILWDLTLDIDQLIALASYWLKDYFLTHPEVKQQLTICDDTEVLKYLPQLLVIQSQELIKIGNINRAKEVLEDAKKLDPNLEINFE
jgi:WD40 repeat protein